MKHRIIIFVFISMCIHVGLMLSHQSNMISIAQNKQGNASLIIELLKQNKTHQQPQQKPATFTENPNRKNKVLPSTSANTKVSPTIHKKHNSGQRISGTKIETRQAASKNAPDFAKISSILKTSLSHTFYYPKTAQRRNWQGQVLVAFVILSNGKIEQIRIDKSSGYNILDRAAVQAIEKIPQQEQLALATNGHDIEQLLPVFYKLVGNAY